MEVPEAESLLHRRCCQKWLAYLHSARCVSFLFIQHFYSFCVFHFALVKMLLNSLRPSTSSLEEGPLSTHPPKFAPSALSFYAHYIYVVTMIQHTTLFAYSPGFGVHPMGAVALLTSFPAGLSLSTLFTLCSISHYANLHDCYLSGIRGRCKSHFRVFSFM